MENVSTRDRPGLAPATLVQRAQELARAAPARPAYTFADYQAGPHGRSTTLTWAETDQRARAVAAVLRGRMLAGERVAVLAPQGLDYVVAMLGAFYARVVAVPLFTPDLPGHADRLARILDDARPGCALTTSAVAPAVAALLRDRALPLPGGVVSVDEVTGGADWEGEPAEASDLAYLQYTSGSTRSPAGVVITHGCLAANAAQIAAALEVEPYTATAVSWLPLFHDMGFVLAVAMPVACAAAAVFTDPVHFLMRPARWLELASGRPDVFTAGPNFAYDYCSARISEEDRAGLDLSGVRAFLNGAEPVRPASLRRFLRAFAGCGLRAEALTPAYGLAEATVCVALGRPRQGTRVVGLDRAALQRGKAVARGEMLLDAADAELPDVPGAVLTASCGVPAGQQVAIVDPETAEACPPGRVGEIWVRGPNVSPGYFRPPAGERDAFGAALAAPPGRPSAGWLRTGDAGVIHDGELLVTGRLKDLIIIDGRNHYPQDIEATAQDAHPAVRRDRVTAFALGPRDDTGTEGDAMPAGDAAPGEADRLVVVAECSRQVLAGQADPAEVTRSVRAAISVRHGVRLHDFRLVRPGEIPRTSSGKIARSACRERYLAGTLGAVPGA